MSVPDRPALYHIVHVDNLASIVRIGGLLSDRQVIDRNITPTGIGMSKIKERRLELPIDCQPGTFVGEYVPFYFCSRSVMLYLISRRNHPELTYRGGQEPIVHLVFDLREVIAWAETRTPYPRSWAISLSNAGGYYVQFRTGLASLAELDWAAVTATDWRPPAIRERKQAECLIQHAVPWHLVRAIGVIGTAIRPRVESALQGTAHKPAILVRPGWYY